MKIGNWRCKLAAALAAGGLLAPSAAYAAATGVNLVINPGFENVDLNTTSYYNAPRILDWTGAIPGHAYSHDLSGAAVPDFANGGPLAGGGHWYFTPGNQGNNSLANAITQAIDVSTGASAALIGAGAAQFDLSAFFSTYAGQQDRGVIRATFLDAANAALGFGEIATPANTNLTTWTEFSATGVIPVGTASVSLASWGIAATGSADGYTDNVYFAVVPEPSTALLVALGASAAALGVRRKLK